MKRLCIILLGATMMFGMGGGLVGCNSTKEENTQKKVEKPPPVRVVPTTRTKISDVLDLTGEVIATNAVRLSATVEGPIAYSPWREGDCIEKAGQKVIEIDRPLYHEEVNAARATLLVAKKKLADLKAGSRPEEIARAKDAVKNLEEASAFARKDMERIESLVGDGAVPGEMAEKARVTYTKYVTELAAAREQLKMLEAGPTRTQVAVQEAMVEESAQKLALAQAKLEECTIKAPFAGIITQVYVRPGDLAVVKAPLVDMMDPSSLVVRFGVPEAQSSAVRMGAEAQVVLDAQPGKIYPAKVVRVYPELSKTTRTRTVEAKPIMPVELSPGMFARVAVGHPCEDRAHGNLVPGMFARVAVALETVEDALVVPDAAILTRPDGTKVAFVVREGKAVMRKVTTGIEQGQRIQILSGIQFGEPVVVAGNENLKNGMPVRLIKDAGSQPEAK